MSSLLFGPRKRVLVCKNNSNLPSTGSNLVSSTLISFPSPLNSYLNFRFFTPASKIYIFRSAPDTRRPRVVLEGSSPSSARRPSAPVKFSYRRKVRASSVVVLVGFGYPLQGEEEVEEEQLHVEKVDRWADDAAAASAAVFFIRHRLAPPGCHFLWLILLCKAFCWRWEVSSGVTESFFAFCVFCEIPVPHIPNVNILSAPHLPKFNWLL